MQLRYLFTLFMFVHCSFVIKGDEKIKYNGNEDTFFSADFSSMKIYGDKIVLSFDNIGGGFVQKTASLARSKRINKNINC